VPLNPQGLPQYPQPGAPMTPPQHWGPQIGGWPPLTPLAPQGPSAPPGGQLPLAIWQPITPPGGAVVPAAPVPPPAVPVPPPAAPQPIPPPMHPMHHHPMLAQPHMLPVEWIEALYQAGRLPPEALVLIAEYLHTLPVDQTIPLPGVVAALVAGTPLEVAQGTVVPQPGGPAAPNPGPPVVQGIPVVPPQGGAPNPAADILARLNQYAQSFRDAGRNAVPRWMRHWWNEDVPAGRQRADTAASTRKKA
jgi:hypothetical protein